MMGFSKCPTTQAYMTCHPQNLQDTIKNSYLNVANETQSTSCCMMNPIINGSLVISEYVLGIFPMRLMQLLDVLENYAYYT